MSRVIDILESIKAGEQYTETARSRAEAILKAIANEAEYSDVLQSRYEELLVSIKNGETTTLCAQTRIEQILVAIANDTLDTYLAGKNLFNEKEWTLKEDIDGENCLVFDGYFTEGSGTKTGNPLVLKTNLKAGSYTVKGKFKKTVYFNALCVMSDNNVRQAVGTMADNFEESSITFTINSPMKYLYIDTGRAGAKGYCKECTLKFEIGSTATPYTPYEFKTELESAYIEASDKLKAIQVIQDGDELIVQRANATQTGNTLTL